MDPAGQETHAVPQVVERIRFIRLIIADNVTHLLIHAATGGQEAVRKALPDIIDFLWKNRSYVKPGRAFARLRKRPFGHYRASRDELYAIGPKAPTAN